MSRTQDSNSTSGLIVLGVDIGGTKIAVGRVDGKGALMSRGEMPTLARDGVDVSVAQVFAAIDSQLTSEVTAIGIAAPGPLNPKTGVILNPSNLPWRDLPLAGMVAERYGRPCKVENDANAAGLAEARFGAGREAASVFYATLGTGVGSGIILDGKVYHGKNGAAAEGGHMTIDYRSDAICNCGTRGCIEALASGFAIERAGGYDIDELAERLSAWLGSVISLLDPDVIVVGGGMTKIGEPLFDRLRARTPHWTINHCASGTPIVPAALGPDVGIIGGAAAWF